MTPSNSNHRRRHAFAGDKPFFVSDSSSICQIAGSKRSLRCQIFFAQPSPRARAGRSFLAYLVDSAHGISGRNSMCRYDNFREFPFWMRAFSCLNFLQSTEYWVLSTLYCNSKHQILITILYLKLQFQINVLSTWEKDDTVYSKSSATFSLQSHDVQ